MTTTTRLLGRATTTLIALLSMLLATTFAGSGWFDQLKRWITPSARSVHVRAAAQPGPVGAPITVTPMRPLGNDSSISSVPLSLVLVRTQPGRNDHEGFAQIGVNARSPQTYAAGSLLVNGARIAEIYAEHVVLERNGRAVKLYLAGRGSQSDVGAGRELLTVGGPSQDASPLLIKSQESFTDYVRLTPMFVGGKFHGYAAYTGRNPGPFWRFGLEPGDVLTAINGTPVSLSGDSLATLRTLLDGAALSIEVERGGETRTLPLDGSILSQAANLDRALKSASGPKTGL